MQPAEQQHRNDSGSKKRLPLDVLLVFDELAMGLAGMRLFHGVTAKLQGIIDTRLSLWKLSVLRVEELRTAALDDAAQADLVVLALRDAAGLAHLGQTWVADWLERRAGQPGALVLYADGPAAAPDRFTELRDYFSIVARLARMDFFSVATAPTKRPPRGGDGVCFRSGLEVGDGFGLEAEPTLPHVQRTSGWGLNEW